MQCIYLQGLHYKETAAKLGISIATVNTLLVNALKKIRQAYPDITQNIILFFFYPTKKDKKPKTQKIKFQFIIIIFSTISKKVVFSIQ